ncbi:MAG: DUF4249 domain-containing protein [Bacteroidota bacterium]
MNQIKFLLVLFGAVCLLSSCEQVIDVELDSVEEQIVIEAQLKQGNHVFTVLISQTAPYFDNQAPVRIDNATVLLSDDTGWSQAIPSVGNGVYSAPVEAQAGRNYQLQVEIDGVFYEASSFLPEPIALEEVYTEFQNAFANLDEGYLVYFRYRDPGNTDNYYRVIHSLNGQPQLEGSDLQVFDDNLVNGNLARTTLFQQIFNPGDSVTIELVHFDEASYDYFNSLSDIVGGGGPSGGSAAPGNPNSNWSGGILGYFSAYSSDQSSIRIPE